MDNIGVEIDVVVEDCLAALARYEFAFPVERIEVTDLPTGQNEAVFTIFGTRFHFLDAVPDAGLVAPGPEGVQSVWFNLTVPDIAATHAGALDAGFVEIQPVTEIPEMGVSNSILGDGHGLVWMLHQVHRDVPFEDRVDASGR